MANTNQPNPASNWRPPLSGVDHRTDEAIRIAYDNLYYLRDRVEQVAQTVPAAAPTMTEIKYELQSGGSAPLNLTGLPGTVPASVVQGSYETKPAVTVDDNGKLYYATTIQTYSCGVLFVVNSGVWTPHSGFMTNTKSPDHRPTNLATTDVGFRFKCSDTFEDLYWTGSAWADFVKSIDSPTLFVDSTNHRVGIGTKTPANKLNVVDASTPVIALIAGSADALRVTDTGTETELAATDPTGVSTFEPLALNATQVHMLLSSVEKFLLDANGVKISTKFGCNSATPQAAYASGGAAGVVSGTATNAGYGFVSALEMNNFITAVNALITLANNIRTALVNAGLMS